MASMEWSIKIEPLPLPTQEITKCWDYKIRITDEFFQYRFKGKCRNMNEDEGLGWNEEFLVDEKMTYPIHRISELKMSWSSKADLWKVNVDFSGVNDPISMFFKGKGEAEGVHDKILEAMFNLA